MKRRQLLFAIPKGTTVAIVCQSSTPAQEELDAVKVMPDTHKLLFENRFMRDRGQGSGRVMRRGTGIRTMSWRVWLIVTPS
jgi:hypothetical protein